VLPGSTCEVIDDYNVVRLDIAFPGTLDASQVIAITRWSNADPSCVPLVGLWATDMGELTGVAGWENGAVYMRQSEQVVIEMRAAIGIVMDCPGAATFLDGEVRLDSARDGHGKLMVTCTRAFL
jgi:hypothetical protein